LRPIADARAWGDDRKAYWKTFIEEWDEQEDGLYEAWLRLQSSDEIVLWLGTELADQIALAWLPAFVRALDAQNPRMRIVQFEHGSRDDQEVLSVAMLDPKEVAAHAPPVLLTPEDLTELDTVWRALTSPEPDALIAYLGAPSGRFPLLGRALREGLARYPDTASGVNRWEARLLYNVERVGPKSVRVIAHALADSFHELDAETGGRDQVGDAWLYARMVRLADPSLRQPVLEIDGSPTEYRESEVRLTPFGKRVLDGKANVVDVNGIDDWVFGVHLQADAGRVWFHRDGGLSQG
jgi:hypothetical protein